MPNEPTQGLSSSQLSPMALADLAASGLTPHNLGCSMSEILRDIAPLDIDIFSQYFPNDSMIWKYTKADDGSQVKSFRLSDGYGWQYGNSLRLKNLDREFLVRVGGVPQCGKDGKVKSHRYLSPKGGAAHIYLMPEDIEAANSKSVSYFVVEGEKKKRLLTGLLKLLPHFPQKHLTSDKKYCTIGLQGVYSTETVEMDEISGGTKEGQTDEIPFHTPDFSPLNLTGREVWFCFDADAEVNPDIVKAELRSVGLFFMRGAALKRMKSLSWEASRGKGIDDYLMDVKGAALGAGDVFNEQGEIICDHHPMLDGLNQLIKLSVHPFKRWNKMPLDFVIKSVTSGVKAGFVMTDVLKAELVDVLKAEGYKGISKSVLTKSITKHIAAHLQDKQQHEDAMTELRLSEMMEKTQAGKLLYNTISDLWMYYDDGKVWRTDGTTSAHAIRAAKEMLRTADQLFEADDVALMSMRDQMRKMENHNTLLRIVAHAATLESFIRTEEDFDAAPHLLNVQNCVIDLNTGKTQKHTPEQMHSKIANVEYQADAICPEWIKFLNVIFQNVPYVNKDILDELLLRFPYLHTKMADWDMLIGVDITESDWTANLDFLNASSADRRYIDTRCRKQYEKVRFLQQCLGLSLTGYSNEKIFIFAHGAAGNNGKSTIFNVFERMLGNYFTRIPVASLLARGHFKSDLNDAIADLRGVRMAVTDEFNDGVLDIAQLKSLTGAETVTCRRPHEKTLRFDPKHTLWGFGNTKPRIIVQNDPVWTRLMLLEFPVSLTELAERGLFTIRDMSEVVRDFLAEAPGILNWAITGYRDYRASQSLRIPDCIKADSQAYKQTQDTVRDFLDEMCAFTEGAKVARARLWRVYCKWCTETNTKQKQRSYFFDDLLTHAGITGKEGAGNVYYLHGVTLRVDELPMASVLLSEPQDTSHNLA